MHVFFTCILSGNPNSGYIQILNWKSVSYGNLVTEFDFDLNLSVCRFQQLELLNMYINK